MNRRILVGLLGSTAAIALCGATNSAQAAACNTPFTKGNVFASVGNSLVDEFTPTGTLVCQLGDASGATFTTGSAFDANGKIYITNFGSDAGAISRFNNDGSGLVTDFMTGTNTPESINIQSSGFYSGQSLVGGPGAAIIDVFNTTTGALNHAYSVAGGNGTGGTDWVDVYNPTTGQIIYDGEGTAVKSAILNANGTVTQLPNFTSAATEAALTHIFAMRTIPTGTFAGDVLLANSVDVVMLDSAGNIIKTYLTGDVADAFSLNLDPNGTDFWAGDFSNGKVFEVNVATGAIDSSFLTGTGAGTLYGISVFGEITSGGVVPEPTSLALLGSGLAGLGLAWRRRRKAA